ncbi:MAG: PIN domain-containing protein [Desulfobaccales bacterium]
MKKIYILDTNVLLHDPESLFAFEDNSIVLPLSVIEELDRTKRRGDEVGRNARDASRKLDELRFDGSSGGRGQTPGRRLHPH